MLDLVTDFCLLEEQAFYIFFSTQELFNANSVASANRSALSQDNRPKPTSVYSIFAGQIIPAEGMVVINQT